MARKATALQLELEGSAKPSQAPAVSSWPRAESFRASTIPGPGRREAEADSAALRRALTPVLKVEPAACGTTEVERLDRAKFQVSSVPPRRRCLTCWPRLLLRRFWTWGGRVGAEFVGLGHPRPRSQPRGAIGFDSTRALHHVCTRALLIYGRGFVLESIRGCSASPRGSLLDVGGIPVPKRRAEPCWSPSRSSVKATIDRRRGAVSMRCRGGALVRPFGKTGEAIAAPDPVSFAEAFRSGSSSS